MMELTKVCSKKPMQVVARTEGKMLKVENEPLCTQRVIGSVYSRMNIHNGYI